MYKIRIVKVYKVSRSFLIEFFDLSIKLLPDHELLRLSSIRQEHRPFDEREIEKSQGGDVRYFSFRRCGESSLR